MSDVDFEPILVCMGCAVVAIRPRDGVILWHVPTPQPVTRLFRVEERLFAVYGTSVLAIDVTHGQALGQVDVGFAPDAGLVCDGHLVLVGGPVGGNAIAAQSGTPHGAMVCLSSDGSVLWGGALALEGEQAHLLTFGADRQPLSDVRYPWRGGPAGIAYAGVVVQPDLRP
jgi:hypothetical protein